MDVYTAISTKFAIQHLNGFFFFFFFFNMQATPGVDGGFGLRGGVVYLGPPVKPTIWDPDELHRS